MHLRQAHGREMSICTDGEFTVSAKGQSWCFEVKDVARFYWREGSATIQFEYLTDGSEDLLAFWLIHIVVPLWFTLEGTGEFFHACSVEIDGAPIMFTAPSMGGKSTLTEYFLRRGHGLVSDDKVAIVEERGKFLAIPSHPNHRPYRRFEDLGIRVDSFCSKSAQIGAVYNLRRVAPDEAVQITEVVGHRKFAVMRPSYLFDFGALRERRLAFTAAMADSLSIYEVDLPWSLEKLEEVYDGICDHFSQRENC
ncbi:MAG: hypothetical protein KJN78_04810 [Gammaproteobacteria bacterium]|nr:hypothetical protein [Gammaproteobacteria bacterium]